FGRDRIGELQISIAAAEQLSLRFRQERPGDRLVEAAHRQRSPGLDHPLLQRIEHRTGDRMGPRHRHQWYAVEADNAADLLDEIGFAKNVGAPGWNGTGEAITGFAYAEAEGGEN